MTPTPSPDPERPPVHTCGAINAPCEHPLCSPAPSAPGEGTERPPHDPYGLLDKPDLLPLERTAASSFPNNPGIERVLLDTYERGADHGIGHATILSLVYRCRKAEADLLALRLIDAQPPVPPQGTERPDTAATLRAAADDLDHVAEWPSADHAPTLRRTGDDMRSAADELDTLRSQPPVPLSPAQQPDGQWREAIWHILVNEAGANPDDRDAFLALWPECVEYRFGGHLGSGGKIWAPGSKRSVPVVDFYPESYSVARAAVTARVNAHLCDAYVLALSLGRAATPGPPSVPTLPAETDEP